MDLFDRFKKLIACVILTAFIPSQAWAQGITIPANSSFNLNTGHLIVPGDITVKTSGTLSATTGPISLTGNWANSGTFNAGTSTVTFNAPSGTQTLDSGGVAVSDAFYKLTHSAAGTLQLTNGHAVLINSDFTNNSGTFNANSLDMTVDGNWDNTATFTAGTQNVILDGTLQSILGTTTFSSLTKIVASADTLLFDHGGTQTVTKILTLGGAVNPNRLSLNSDSPPTKAALTLVAATGSQNISNVSVLYSNASGGATLIGRNDSVDGTPNGTNLNWDFGNATITWTGAVSTEWQNPSNWDIVAVPAAGDTVIIPNVANEPDLCPTGHTRACLDVTIGNLTINASSSLTLGGKNLTVALVSPAVGVFTNSGTVFLKGNEVVTLTQDTTNHGTFNYQGTNTGSTDSLLTSYYNLIIDDTNVTKDTFAIPAATTIAGDATVTSAGTITTAGALTVDGNTLVTSVGTITTNGALTADGNLTLTAGTLDISTHANTLTVANTLSLGASGVLTATAGNITANGAVTIASGATFTAPGTGKTFTVTGNFTNNAGNFVAITHTTGFNNSSGLVTLNGGDQSVLGSTAFYQFSKTVATAHTLTFDHTGTQTFANSLTLVGAAGNQLAIRSDLTGTAAAIDLLSGPGVTQNISEVSVENSNAGALPADATLVGRNGSVDAPPGGTNTNWSFGAAIYKWTGGTSTEWNLPTNWNLGTVPSTAGGDTIEIPSTANQPDLCPAGHVNPCTAVNLGSLTLDASTTLTLSGQNLTVTSGAGTFTNSGTIFLHGNEAVSLTQDTVNHGTFDYVGTNTASTDNLLTSYYNLIINDANGTKDAFVTTAATTVAGDMTVTSTATITTNGSLGVTGNLTLTAGTLNISTHSNPLTVGGILSLGASGTLTATNSNIAANGAVTIASGATFTAPGTGKTFTVTGNWTNHGTFNNSSGTVTLNGGDQSVLGSTVFYQFAKTVAAAHTLTFDHTGTQTFANGLTLGGASLAQLLSIRSDLNGTQADIVLMTGGTQMLNFLDVKDSNAGTASGVGLAPSNSHDSGNNINWFFAGAALIWKGTASTDWGTTPGNASTNWDLGFIPRAADTVTIANAANQPILSAAVTVSKLTINTGSTVSLNGNNLSVTLGANTFTNSGTVFLHGNEAVTLTPDPVITDHGTFNYQGSNTGATDTLLPSYYNLIINDANVTKDIFITSGAVTTLNDMTVTSTATITTNGDLTSNGNLTLTAGTLDISTHSNTLTVANALALGATGVLTATNGNITANGAVTIASGAILTAPGASKTFTVTGNWTNNGTFNNSSGTVTLNGGDQSVFGSTVFSQFIKTITSPHTLTFDHTGTQTFNTKLTMSGVSDSQLLSIRSDLSGTQAALALNLAGSQTIDFVDVKDSNAGTAGVQQTLIGANSTNSGNNVNWQFFNLQITAPYNTTTPTVGQTPTIIGTGPVSTDLFIRGIIGTVSVIVASVKTDVNGAFRVVVGHDDAGTGIAPGTVQLDTGANSLTPFETALPATPGRVSNLIVAPTTTTSQVPVISTINGIAVTSGTQTISGSTPTLTGQGLPSQPVIVDAITIQAGVNRVLTAVGSGSTDASGNYTVTLTTPLPSSSNFLSVTVNGVASALIPVSLTEPFGIVYNSSSNQSIQGAIVTLYDATTQKVATTGIQSCNTAGTCCDMSGNCCTGAVCTAGNPPGNPFTTGADGFYSFLTPGGQYYLNVSAGGYTYPSVQTTIPAGRSVVTGSEGQAFTTGTQVAEIDLPLDGNSTLLHITKVANKSEASVGDIVMYTVNIQNMSATNPVNDVLLTDMIPPGFKYIKDRVLLGGTPIHEPTGPRPLVFNVGTVAPSAMSVLQYQLVIGSGVTMGTYKNTAQAIQVSDPVYAMVNSASFNGSGADLGNGALIISNPAQALVKIIPDPVFDLGTVIGKVFFDWNENGIQDAPYYDAVSHETIVEKPVPNVQIVMEDGTVITTDRNGQYNIPGLLPGRHLFRVDERTLPPGSYMTTDKAIITNITAGSITKVNFGVNIDETQATGRDAVFFNEKIRLTQDQNRPVPRLNAALFDASANAQPNTEEVLLNEGALVRQAEFRIFTNYSPFIGSWHLDILDADTKKLIRQFEGTPLNINDPIYWNGRDDHDVIISADHKYSYILTVVDNKNNSDTTKENPITIREIKDDVLLKKERDETKDVLKDRADRYRKWLDAQTAVNNVDHQLIPVQGETIHLDRQGTDVKSIRVMKGNQLFTDIPLSQQYGLTPEELMAGGFSMADEKDNMEIILPNGDYSLDVISTKPPDDADSSSTTKAPAEVPQSVKSSGIPSRTLSTSSPGTLEHYSRPLKVGDDYMMFVALGDAQVGYNIDRGNIEPIQDATEEPGLYHEGKGAYYLKGKILGKYLITSSYDSDRAEKALFRSLDPNVYYPVYGDGSTINYDAADTQGALYLKVEWDKSTAILGNYAVDFNDTDFAAFSQKYYGGKLDYQSVATNSYGDARTKLVVYHAQVQQLPSHNEFLATGGSLYFLKYMNVIQGSDTVTIQVRDQTTGLVISSQVMVNGADYELDLSQGRILFWQPVAMIAQSESIISNGLINGNPIYVVVDYQYAASGMQTQPSEGARVAQAVGDNVVLGGTYLSDNSNGQEYTLEGTDATLHVNKDSTIKAEYAQTTSQETGSYVSTDGGISFTPLMLESSATGKAYGIKGDTRLFDNIGLKSYYKWVGSDFGATSATSQQGTESMGLSMTWDMTPVTRVTASEDIQRLMAGANLQASTQVGASETDTTMIQVVHTAERLKLTGQFQLIETKNVIDGVESTTNQKGATFGGQAQYDLTNRIKLTMGQQVDVMDSANTATTLGIADRLTDHATANLLETFSSQGHALTAGLTNQLTDKMALTTAYTLTSLNTGETDKTASVGVSDQINKNLTTTGTVAQTASSTGSNTTTASVGAKAKISDAMTMDVSVGKTQDSLGQSQGGTSINLNGTTQIGNTTVTGTAQTSVGTSVSDALGIGSTGVTTTSSFGVLASTKVDNNTTTNGSVNVANETTGDKTTTVGFGNTSKLDQELQAVTSNSFSFSPDNGTTDASKYGIVRSVDGKNLEGDYTRQSDTLPGSVSESNIYGLTGDVNDRLALNGTVETGKVQNLDTTQTLRTDFTFGAGYVLKDTETAVERLKNSIKLELRLDKGAGGADSYHQYVLYDALEGKITDNFTVNAKIDYSKTLDVTTGAVAERHQEIILGMAYRPVSFDNLNFITEYSYQDGFGGGIGGPGGTGQADALNTSINQTITQVLSAEGVYDINDKWQVAEKLAYRIENEQDTGFAFTQTHTWLVIHRLNYKIDRNWTISGEYRDLAQVEAKDNKQGILLEATRELNANTELAIGWNFTNYTDDLTNLSYSSQGPYVRMTGKFYDETPEERARARAKWLDARINDWAWVMIRKELGKKDSKIVLELNRMFALAQKARTQGRLEESRQIYKDIISAGQMMYDEASEYIRGRIAFEEQLQQLDKTAREYFKGGEYVKARKIWEKVVEDASKGGKIKNNE
jgi:hypothetical protein